MGRGQSMGLWRLPLTWAGIALPTTCRDLTYNGLTGTLPPTLLNPNHHPHLEGLSASSIFLFCLIIWELGMHYGNELQQFVQCCGKQYRPPSLILPCSLLETNTLARSRPTGLHQRQSEGCLGLEECRTSQPGTLAYAVGFTLLHSFVATPCKS